MSRESLAEQIETLLFDHDALNRMSQAAMKKAPYEARDKQLQVLADYLPGLVFNVAAKLDASQKAGVDA